MNEATTWTIHRIKGTNPRKYEAASDVELKQALRSGDSWAGAQLLKRQRAGTLEIDKLENQQKERQEEEKLYQEMKTLNEELENA